MAKHRIPHGPVRAKHHVAGKRLLKGRKIGRRK